MAISFDVEDKDLTPRERLQKAEEQRLNFKQMRLNEAHNRFMQSHDNWVMRHREAATIGDRQRVFGQESEDRLREHEQEMLQQKGLNEFNVAHEKRMGMKEQGVDAANASGEWGFKTEHERGQNALSLEERKSALQKELAAIEAATKQYGFETEWGKTNPDGTRTPGGREAIAGIEGQAKVGAAEAQAKAQAELNAQKNALEEQKRIAAAEKEKGRLKLQYDKLEQKDKAAVDSAANSLAKEKGISFEDARAQVMAGREQAQQNAEPQEGATKTLSSGRKVVYRGGKWQYAD